MSLTSHIYFPLSSEFSEQNELEKQFILCKRTDLSTEKIQYQNQLPNSVFVQNDEKDTSPLVPSNKCKKRNRLGTESTIESLCESYEDQCEENTHIYKLAKIGRGKASRNLFALLEK